VHGGFGSWLGSYMTLASSPASVIAAAQAAESPFVEADEVVAIPSAEPLADALVVLADGAFVLLPVVVKLVVAAAVEDAAMVEQSYELSVALL